MVLSGFDLGLVFVYFAVLVIVGFLSSRRQQEEDYLIAKRNLGTWSTMATMNASKSGSIFMIFVALTFIWGFSAVWYFIGVIFGTLLFIPFSMKLKEKSGQVYYTLADYFKHNYGKISGKFASTLTIFLMFGFLVINLIAGTKIFVFFTGWAFWACASIMILIVLVYLILGGFKAVVKTDILQYIAMISILFFLTIILFNGSLIPASEWAFFNVDLVTLVGFFLLGMLFPFASPDLWQRVYSSKGKKELRNGLLLSVLLYALMSFLLALLALTVKVNFPNIDPDLALIHGFANLLPTGLLGLSVVLLFSAIMSSIDTYIFTGSSAIVQDFFDWNKKKVVKNIRRIMFLFAILAAAISIAIQSLIIGSYIFVAIEVILGFVVVMTWINYKTSERAILFGLSFGSLALIAFLIFSLVNGAISESIVIISLAATILGLVFGKLLNFLS